MLPGLPASTPGGGGVVVVGDGDASRPFDGTDASGATLVGAGCVTCVLVPVGVDVDVGVVSVPSPDMSGDDAPLHATAMLDAPTMKSEASTSRSIRARDSITLERCNTHAVR
jgi:hypothetical protein